jgi:hypothetical protein
VTRSAWWIPATAASLLLLAACTTNTTGSPTPSTTAPATTNTVAPRVAKPLDASGFIKNVCSTLTSNQLAALNMPNPSGDVLPDEGDPLCSWSDLTTNISFGISWMPTMTGGLSDVYARAYGFGYWDPTAVDGYPAVYAGIGKNDRAGGDCEINVAVNDHLYFLAHYIGNHQLGTRSCDLAKQAATDVIHNLGGA